jgi:putative PEP-CTERM system TPR-repeat lipoprotein
LLESGDPFGATVELGKVVDSRSDDTQALPLLARAMLLAGEAKKLTSLYGSVTLPDKAANASLRSSVASAWGSLGDKARTQAEIDAALASVPDFPAALILRARVLAGAGDYAQAVQIVDKVLAGDPSSAEAWQLKGEILTFGMNDAKAGEEAFRKAVALDKTTVAAYTSIVGARLRASDIAGAKLVAQAMQAELPRHPQTLYIDTQLAFYDKDLKKALDGVQQLLRMAPNNKGVLQLAGAVFGQAGSLSQAQSNFAKALQIDPELGLARRGLAKIYIRLGQPAKALAVLKPMLDSGSPDAEAFGLAGESSLQLSDGDAAETYFTRAAQIDPKDPRILTALALRQLGRGEVDAAYSRLSRISADSKDSFVDLAIISSRLKRKEFDQALAAVDVLDAKQPDSAMVSDLRGRVQLARQDHAAARKAFERALAQDKSYFAATGNLAALDMLEKKPQDARKRLEESVARDPRSTVLSLVLAELLTRTGARPDEIRAVLDEAIRNAPSESEPRVRLVEYLSSIKRNKDALSVAEEAVAALPGDPNVLDALGRAQAQNGDFQQAITSFRKEAGLDERSARPYARLADVYKAAGNRAAAITSIQRILEIEPGNISARANLVELVVLDGRPKDGLAIAKEIQRRTPHAPEGYLLESAVLRRMKNDDAALAVLRTGFDKATPKQELIDTICRLLNEKGRRAESDQFAAQWLKQHPDDTFIAYRVASTLISRGEVPRAETLLRRIVELSPKHALALNNLAWTLVVQHKPGATAFAQRAVDLLPDQASIIDTLASALAADQQVPRALELQRKAVDLAPTDMGLRLNLAKIAIQAGDKALARTELDRLAALGEKLPYQKEVTRLAAQL